MNAEIQIQFLRPGDWQEFALTAIYRDADGYTLSLIHISEPTRH